MSLRLHAGTCLTYSYNHWLSNCPSRRIRRAFLRRYLGAMGAGTGVQMSCKFLNARKIHLGERNVINFGCLLDGRKHEIRTGNDVAIGPEATILTLGHDPQSPDFADRGGDVIIGDRVWIGYGAIVLPGVNIGEGVVVAAGAIVTKSLDPYGIYAGSPARRMKERTRGLTYRNLFAPFLF